MYVAPHYNVPSKAQRKICLVVVDMQNCFFDEDEHFKEKNQKELENIAEAIRLFHEHSRDVFMIQYIGETHSLCKDMNFIKELGEIEPCTVVEKHHSSAFFNTLLSDLVVERGYDSVLICGAYAEHCIMSTYWNAINCDITPFLLSEGVIAYVKEKQKSVEDICSVFTMDDLRENLKTATIDPDYNSTTNRMRRKYWYVN